MKLLIVATLLTVVQASGPTPKKTADTTTVKQPSPASQQPPITNTVQPNSTGAARADDQPQSIKVREVPPVTVASPKRDWVDWGYWFFSLLLAIAGIFQILLLRKTLKITAKQTTITENQKALMEQAGHQTERIIDQMKETTVRELRAYIGVSKVYLSLEVPTLPRGIIEVENFGRTPAYKVRQWIRIEINPYPPTSVFPEPTHGPASMSVIPPGVKNTSHVPLSKPLPTGVSVGTPALTVYVFGEVTYEDAFRQERKTSYRFIYGGPEGGKSFRNANGVLLGAMNPDTGGNDAN